VFYTYSAMCVLPPIVMLTAVTDVLLQAAVSRCPLYCIVQYVAFG